MLYISNYYDVTNRHKGNHDSLGTQENRSVIPVISFRAHSLRNHGWLHTCLWILSSQQCHLVWFPLRFHCLTVASLRWSVACEGDLTIWRRDRADLSAAARSRLFFFILRIGTCICRQEEFCREAHITGKSSQMQHLRDNRSLFAVFSFYCSSTGAHCHWFLPCMCCFLVFKNTLFCTMFNVVCSKLVVHSLQSFTWLRFTWSF